MATRLSRVEQVERNRATVLEAARRVFLERGYAGAGVDAIAEQAGFSKGVVYSQFAGKPDLFLGLLERRIAERAEENARLAASHAGIDGLQALLAASARRSLDGGSWSLLLIEFRVVAARDPGLNARYSALHQRSLEHFAESVREVLARGGLGPSCPPRTFAALILAVDSGSALERAGGVDDIRPELLGELLSQLVEPL